ncbi:MAG TPA: MraY family glycosyltransferase [Ignavibacteriaceae bacterium]|nr:MraY family glycosyltransferase [Ignavibacteriaceae bacterium]
MIYLIIFFTSLVLTIFFTPVMIDFFTRIKVVDNPDELRRINKSIIPRMGGILIYVIVMVSTISFFGDLNSIRFFVVASGIIALLGMADDMIGVKWNHKFIIQFIMSIFLFYFLAQDFDVVKFFGFELPYPLNYIIIILFIVGAINSVNLLDGLDGLVSGFSLMVIFVSFLVGFNTGNKFLLVLSASLMGALIGFLKFNAFPARIFLGDTGAYVLGFFLVTATLMASTNVANRVVDLTFPVILMAVPIVDTIKVMILRLIDKRNPFIADMSHVHHVILNKIPNHKVTVFILESIALVFAVISLYYLRGDKTTATILFAVFSVPFLLIHLIIKIFRKPVFPDILTKLYRQFPQIFISVYIKYFIPLIAIFSFTLLIGLAPVKSNTNNIIILLSILFVILLFVYSLINYQKNKYFNDILVFFNLMLFLLYSNYSEQIKLFDASGIFEVSSSNLMIFMLVPSIVFFFLFREKIMQKKVSLFSGIDLIILVFIMLLSVSSNLLPTKQFANSNVVLFHSFLIYIFYKVFVILRTKYQPAIFFLSFIIPILLLVHLLITQ